MHRQAARFEPLLFNTNHMNQSKTNVPSINQKPIHIAPDPFLFGFSNPKTFTLLSIPPTPVILRGAEGEVAESVIQKITSSFRERGTVADGG